MNTLLKWEGKFLRIKTTIPNTIAISHVRVGEILGKNKDQKNEITEAVRSHIIRWFLNPDPGSPFDKKTKYWRNLIPQSIIVRLMLWKWYDGIITLFDWHIIGHAFFQAHKKKTGNELHLFSIAVADELRRRWIGTAIAQTFIEHGRSLSNISRLRMWGGGDENVRAIFDKVGWMQGKIWITTDDNYFIWFTDRNERKVESVFNTTSTK